MRFTKMHGAGNDYVYVDRFRESLPDDAATLADLARRISDRHTGVGGDGLILIEPPRDPAVDARMRMFNADGSEAEMCGNGVRCVAKYVYDHRIARRDRLRIETARGTLEVALRVVEGSVASVRVNMGRPILEALRIPTTLPGDPPVDAMLPLEVTSGEKVTSEVEVTSDELRVTREGIGSESSSMPPAHAPLVTRHSSLVVTCVSMGNPHCVVFVDEPSDDWVLGLGPRIERHPAFPNRVNVEFVQVLSPGEIRMRVWERGAGETQACGSGACAAAVAGVLSGRTERRVLARLPGGDLELEWTETGDVFLTGPAVEVFSGEWTDHR
ncbi:MAG: diaminopimelate epimerase [Planctomycetaceae bacterium]